MSEMKEQKIVIGKKSAQAIVDYMAKNEPDYINLLREYHELLGWNDAEYPKCFDQKTAKSMLKEDLEFILGTNGESELTENERELCELVGIELENEKLGSKIIRHHLEAEKIKVTSEKDITIADVEDGTALLKAEELLRRAKKQSYDAIADAEHLVWKLKNWGLK